MIIKMINDIEWEQDSAAKNVIVRAHWQLYHPGIPRIAYLETLSQHGVHKTKYIFKLLIPFLA